MHLVNLINDADGKNPSSEVKAGVVTKRLLDNLNNIDEEGKEIILKEAASIMRNCADPTAKDLTQNTGIVIGYVQSGKTLSFTTLIGLAADNDYRIVVVLAGTKNNLLDQTTRRLESDLEISGANREEIKLTSEPEKFQLRKWLKMQRRPLVVVPLLKHSKYLNELVDILNSHEVKPVLGDGAVLIIDDEADQASLNTYARKNSKKPDWEDGDYSATYLSILRLKNQLTNHTFLQYTATPQGPLLISLTDILSPSFHIVLTPGKGYTGGDEFFNQRSNSAVEIIPEGEVYHRIDNALTQCPHSLRTALIEFLLGATIHLRVRQNEGPFTMMVHPDREKFDCDLFFGWVKNMVNRWVDVLDPDIEDIEKASLLNEFRSLFSKLKNRIPEKIEFEEIERNLYDILLDSGIWLVIGKDNTKFPEAKQKINWDQHPVHILVGADMLNRGFTVEGLAVTYMPRYSKSTTMADTMQQRARFFGYKAKYADLCRIYLPIDSFNEYSDYVEDEETLRDYLKSHSLEEMSQVLLQSDKMKPTRGNILSRTVMKTKMQGARSLVGLDRNIIAHNNALIKTFEFKYAQDFKLFEDFNTTYRNHGYVKVDIKEVIDLLHKMKAIKPSEMMRKIATLQYLRFLRISEIHFVNVFKMDLNAEVGDERKRSVIESDGFFNSKNIFSGRSNSGKKVYPGDREIKFDDSLNIQLYSIRLESDTDQSLNNVIFRTLGFVYPEGLEKTFIGID